VRPTTVELEAVDLRLVPGGAPVRVPVRYDVQVVQQAIAAAAQRMRERGE
jgi:hypothetical protein